MLPYIAVVWVVIRIAAISFSGGWSEAFSLSLRALWFWCEMILTLVPAYLIFATDYGRSQSGLFVSGALFLLGGAMYRFGTYLVGYNAGDEWGLYLPTVSELMISICLVAIEILGYSVLVKLLPVLPNVSKHGAHK